ncbi:FGGY family carbohydrate kinase [Micrococcaceae bacterium Sec5.7]
MTLVAGVDSSTQSCKVVILDAESGALVRDGRASHPEGTEVHPDHWWQALSAAIDDAGGLADVSGLSVGGQQHGMVLLDSGGNIVRPALLWNDTRSAESARALTREVGAENFAARTGVVPVASFTVTKVRWVRDHEPENAARAAAVALPHDWLTWRLRGYGPAGSSPLGPDLEQLTTDRSDASGTGYWSPVTGSYDLELFRLAFGREVREARGVADLRDAAGDRRDAAAAGIGVEAGSRAEVGHGAEPAWAVILPRVLAPAETGGHIHPDSFSDVDNGLAATNGADVPDSSEGEGTATSEGERILLGPGAGDNAAAALGLGAKPGDVVVSVGTSGTVFAVAAELHSDATGIVAVFADASGLHLPIAVTLNAARVLSSVAGLLDVDFDRLSTLALEAEPGSGGVVLVPYFEGERTPNLPHATASFHGLSIASTTRPNIARAAIEGMLCGLSGGLEALQALGYPAERLLLIGGAVQNPAVQKIAAQVFDLRVVIPSPGEYVARGAAVQAAWALTGTRPAWDLALDATPEPDFHPSIGENYRKTALG